MGPEWMERLVKQRKRLEAQRRRIRGQKEKAKLKVIPLTEEETIPRRRSWKVVEMAKVIGSESRAPASKRLERSSKWTRKRAKWDKRMRKFRR